MTKFHLKAKIAILLAISTISFSAGVAYAFSDVLSGSWYYKYVKYLEDSQIAGGYPDGTYRPDQTVSNAESLALFIKALKIPVSNDVVPAGSHWSYNYIQAASELDALTSGFVPDAPIKRGEAAEIIYGLLGFSQDSEVGSQQTGIFRDANTAAVNKLYGLGIFEGYAETGGLYFKPDNKMTRAEQAVVVKKLSDYKTRIVGDFTIQPVLLPGDTATVTYPETVEDFEHMFLAMAANEEFKKTISYTYEYKNKIKDESLKDAASEAFANVYSEYPEFFAFTNGIETSGAYGTYTNQMTFEICNNDFSDEEVTAMRSTFFKEADEIMRALIIEGKLTADMTDKQKARVFYEWMALNNKYDLDYNKTSFNGYGASHYQTAVCQGYTALYNVLCKKAGVKVQGITGIATGSNAKSEGHMWTLAVLDGKKVHIDTTFGDPVPDVADRCNFDYFAVGSDFISKNHSWDKDKYGI